MPLRIGIVNLMPSAEQYEPMLLSPLVHGRAIEPVWIRLRTHGYASSDAAHLAAHYRPYDEVGALDGLIITGAPVEELAYEDVRYFAELRALIEHAREVVPRTLGLCWGGMALAHVLGIDKRMFTQKLFGVYPLVGLPAYAGQCAQSRHAGLDDAQLARAEAQGSLRILAGSARTGHTIVESRDARLLMHLGHPEYTPARLRFEYERDRALGRDDVDEPYGVASSAEARPLPHGYGFFARWLQGIARDREREVEARVVQEQR